MCSNDQAEYRQPRRLGWRPDQISKKSKFSPQFFFPKTHFLDIFDPSEHFWENAFLEKTENFSGFLVKKVQVGGYLPLDPYNFSRLALHARHITSNSAFYRKA